MTTPGEVFKFRAEPRSREVLYEGGRYGSTIAIAGYRKCTEYDDQGDFAIGQDDCYAWTDGRHAVAVVVDGVSQSFFGHLAAKWLTDRITECLTHDVNEFPDFDVLIGALESTRGELESAVDDAGKHLPTSLPQLLRTSLEKKRVEIGSLGVFTAAVVDLESRRAKLYAVGDPLAVVFREGLGVWQYPMDVKEKNPDHLKAARYSSLSGLRGDHWEGTFENVTGLLLASDGLVIDPTQMNQVSMLFDEEAFANEAREAATKDDVSFVFLGLKAPGTCWQSVRRQPDRLLARTSDADFVRDAAGGGVE